MNLLECFDFSGIVLPQCKDSTDNAQGLLGIMTVDVTEITVEEMDALIERIENNLTDGLSTEPDDVRLILQILRQFATMQQKLESSSYLKERYLKLMGLISTSEKQDAARNNTANPEKKSPRKKKPRPKTKPVPPKVCHHKLEGLEKGLICPECEKGRLYKTEPASFIRIVGNPPLSAENHIMEQIRCNLCSQLFTAPLPDDVLQDGARQQKYGYSARAIMGISKFYMGNPYYRQEGLQWLMGKPVTASTIYDQCALLVDDVTPVFEALKEFAANVGHFNIDDTGNKILKEKAVDKPNRNGKGTRKRTGVYSSCLIATDENARKTVLFKTNIGHSGEWIDEIFANRAEGLPLPIVMSDALSSNTPQSTSSITSLCNSHSRRKFFDVRKNYPEEVEYVLESYGAIWHNETITETEKMSVKARLDYHTKNSLPVMLELKAWCEKKSQEKATEENNGLGRAIRYFLKHFDGLSAFCFIENAKLDNNLAEMVIKLIVRGRKNSHFYQTLAGANIGDVITSLIATCELNGVNCFDYLVALQQHRRLLELEPERWLPWNYLESLQ